MSKEFVKYAKQTVEKPANYLASNNMLEELDSRQEMKMTTDAPGKVFPEFYIFANIFHCTEIEISQCESIFILMLVKHFDSY